MFSGGICVEPPYAASALITKTSASHAPHIYDLCAAPFRRARVSGPSAQWANANGGSILPGAFSATSSPPARQLSTIVSGTAFAALSLFAIRKRLSSLTHRIDAVGGTLNNGFGKSGSNRSDVASVEMGTLVLERERNEWRPPS